MELIGKKTEDFSFVIRGFGASIFQGNPGSVTTRDFRSSEMTKEKCQMTPIKFFQHQ